MSFLNHFLKFRKFKVSRFFWLIFLVFAVNFYCGPQGGGKSPINDGMPVTPGKFYSKDKPGEWVDYAADHAPAVEINYSKDKDNVSIYVVLKNPDVDHYIESIGLLDEEDKIVDKVTFGQGKKNAAYGYFTFDVRANLSRYRAFARCSRHDLWVTPLDEARKIP